MDAVIKGINSDQIELDLGDGKTTLVVAESVAVTINGARAYLADLRNGDRVTIFPDRRNRVRQIKAFRDFAATDARSPEQPLPSRDFQLRPTEPEAHEVPPAPQDLGTRRTGQEELDGSHAAHAENAPPSSSKAEAPTRGKDGGYRDGTYSQGAKKKT